MGGSGNDFAMAAWMKRARSQNVCQEDSQCGKARRSGGNGVVDAVRPADGTISASTLRDGNLIKQLAHDIVATTPSDNINGMTAVHTYCTACSCSEVSHIVLQHFEKALASVSVSHSFKQVFGCEIDKSLHTWQMETVRDPDCCLFGDMKELQHDRAYCYRHKGRCVVKSAEGIIAGLSCKDFSRMNPKRYQREAGTVLHSTSSEGKSADTWSSFLRYLDKHGPVWIIIENSDMLLEDDVGDCLTVVAALNDRGYFVLTTVFESSEYGTPMARRRTYLVALAMARTDVHSCSTAEMFDNFKTKFTNIASRCRRKPPSLFDVLLPPGGPVLESALSEALAVRHASLQGNTVDLHMTAFRNSKMRWGAVRVRDTTQASRWFPSMPMRQQECLVYYQGTHKHVPVIAGVDISQSLQRMPQTFFWRGVEEDGIVCSPTLLPGTILWMTFPDPGAGTCSSVSTHNRLVEERPLLGEEKMLLQGWPCNTTSPTAFADHRGILSKMAGNMFTSSVILTVFASMFYSIPWTMPSVQSAASDNDLKAAIDALQLLGSSSATGEQTSLWTDAGGKQNRRDRHDPKCPPL